MKVLQINSVCGIRSTGRICTDIADVLEDNGHICKIAYGRENVPEKYKKYAVRIGNSLSVRLDALLTRLFDNAGFNSVFSTRKFIKWVKEYDPDVIHLHNLHGYYINVKILFKYLKKSGKPVLWSSHDCWAFTGHCSHFVTAGCDKWKTGCFKCPKRKAYPSSLFIDNSKKNYKKKKALFTALSNLTIVTPSNWLADLVKKSFLGKYPIKLIPNGIDLDVFKPTESDFREKYALKDKKIVLGVASAWGKGKGLYDFVKLSDILDDNYKVVLVGLKEEQIKEMPEKILCIPRTNNTKELAEIYSAADVFVNPSRAETMGLTTVEAMACGTPVVTSNLTAVPEVVSDDSGIVIDDLSVESIASAIRCVLNNTYDNVCQNAEKYEKTTQYMKYFEIYQEILKKVL